MYSKITFVRHRQQVQQSLSRCVYVQREKDRPAELLIQIEIEHHFRVSRKE